jgi:predicted kinase
VTAGRVHLLYGLAGSGKTTLARSLCADGRAVRFTLDEWMIRLHPDLSFRTAEYGQQTEIVKDLIWSVAEQVLRSGVDVVLDWNSWSRARRAWAVQRAATIPAQITLHVLDTSIEQATTRAEQRDHDPHVAYAHSFSRQDIEHLASIMETPTDAEGFDIIGG